MMTSTDPVLSCLHYDSICNDYDDLFSFRRQYEVKFVEDIFSSIAREDLPNEDTVLAEVGCGTGILLKSLAEQKRFREFLAVEPCDQMLDQVQVTGGTPVRRFYMGGGEFSKLDGVAYDVSIMYGMIHHIPEKALTDFLKGVFNQTNPSGTLLISTYSSFLPFPFWPKHLEFITHHYPTWKNMMKFVKDAGFDDVTSMKRSYGDVVIPRDKWLWMLRNKFCSTLSTVTDEEIEKGIQFMSYPDPVVFEEWQYFVRGRKTLATALKI